MKTVAAAVCDDLCRLRPDQCEGFRARMEAYAAALDAIDGRISLRLAPLAGQEVLVLHPAFGYLLRRYGLRQIAVEVDGKEPAARSLARLIDRARNSGTTVLFVQPQFAGRSAEAVAEAIGGRVVELDPLAANHLANLEVMVDRIASAYGTSRAEDDG
jgi:zinc transport system substrate-binding protein